MQIRVLKRKPMMFIVAIATTFALTSALLADRGQRAAGMIERAAPERIQPVLAPFDGHEQSREPDVRSL